MAANGWKCVVLASLLVAAAVVGGAEAQSFVFVCSSISVNNATGLEAGQRCNDALEGGVCGSGTYVRSVRRFQDGSAAVYVEGATSGSGNECAQYLTGSSCATAGSTTTCTVSECQLSPFGDYGACSKSCGDGVRQRQQIFAFTSVVSVTPPVLLVGKPCMGIIQSGSCSLGECEGPDIFSRFRGLFIMFAVLTGLLVVMIIVAATCRLCCRTKRAKVAARRRRASDSDDDSDDGSGSDSDSSGAGDEEAGRRGRSVEMRRRAYMVPGDGDDDDGASDDGEARDAFPQMVPQRRLRPVRTANGKPAAPEETPRVLVLEERTVPMSARSVGTAASTVISTVR